MKTAEFSIVMRGLKPTVSRHQLHELVSKVLREVAKDHEVHVTGRPSRFDDVEVTLTFLGDEE